jgi:hypothetical protein
MCFWFGFRFGLRTYHIDGCLVSPFSSCPVLFLSTMLIDHLLPTYILFFFA